MSSFERLCLLLHTSQTNLAFSDLGTCPCMVKFKPDDVLSLIPVIYCYNFDHSRQPLSPQQNNPILSLVASTGQLV